jgi:exopolysaccharide biosynthesis polyprenyl glycosylphosphotransferase
MYGSTGTSRSQAQSRLLGRDAVLRRTLAGADVVSAFGALLFATLILGGGRIHLRPAVILLAPFVILVGKAIGLYDRDQHVLSKTTIDEAPSVFHLAVLCSLAVWLTEGLLLRGWLGRAEVFGLVVANLVLMLSGRSLARATVSMLVSAERCLVVGDAPDAARVAEKLSNATSVNAEVIGRVALHVDPTHANDAPEILGDVASLAKIVIQHGIERVIIAPNSHDQEEILHAIRLIGTLGVRVSVLPRLLEVVGTSSTFDDIDGITLLGVRQYGLSASSGMMKRTMDIACAGLAVLVLAPLFGLAAILIKLDGGGPVFFRQRRIGRRGANFEMLKFRSMVPNADQRKADLREHNEAEGGLFKITDDPRITRVGRWLRRSSIDELPQLLNVLRGDMSLVGPRPLVPDEDALIEGWRRRRLAVRPGMTGLWQIFGSSRIPMHEMVKIDYLYGANWSMWLDLKILLRTVGYVVQRRGL